MKRRGLVVGLAAAVAWPLVAQAQRLQQVKKIGLLAMASAQSQPQGAGIDAFRAALRALGYQEGRDFVIEYRYADGLYDRLPALFAELISLRVDVIVTNGVGAHAAAKATSTIPIVVAIVGDALATGLVSSLARPGRNVTGLTFFHPELAAKRLELLKELTPSTSRVAVLTVPLSTSPTYPLALQEMGKAAALNSFSLKTFEVHGPDQFDGVLAEMKREQIDGLVILDDPVFVTNVGPLVNAVNRHPLPAIGPNNFAQAGGLMAYGVNFTNMWRRSAAFVDKIFKGEKPGNIPVERSTKFDVIINLKTAKAMSLEVPTSLLLRADEVIE